MYNRVVEGVTGRDNSQLANEVASAIEMKLQISPDRWQEFISVLRHFEYDLAEQMEQKYKGKKKHAHIQVKLILLME